MIPLTKTLGLGWNETDSMKYGYIYYLDGRLVSNRKVYQLGFRIAYEKGLIMGCTRDPFSRDNRLTEYGEAMMKLMS